MTSTVETPSPLRDLWAPMLLMGVLTVVLGAVVLIWPGVSILAAAVLFGVYLVASGIAQVMFAFSLHVSAPYRVLWFITGALSLILGVLAFRHFGQGYAVLLLALWIGIGFTFQGVAATALAISNKDLPGRGWTIFYGVISIIAGFVVVVWPFDSIVVLALVTGIWLVVIGITEIVSAFQARRDINRVEERVSQVVRGAPNRAA